MLKKNSPARKSQTSTDTLQGSQDNPWDWIDQKGDWIARLGDWIWLLLTEASSRTSSVPGGILSALQAKNFFGFEVFGSFFEV